MPNTRNKKNKELHQQKCINKLEVSVLEPKDNKDKTQEESVCFICWGTSEPTNKIIKIKELILFNSGCDCNSEIHTNCLLDWVNVSKSCPICREEITINIDIYNEIDYFYRATIIMKIKDNVSLFINMCAAVTMMIVKYIILLFFLNALLRIAKEVYYFIIDRR